MKAIYINLDPYLQAVADWLNAGHPGTVPSFQPLPVAVTIPLGESACIYCPSAGEAETDPVDQCNSVTVDGKTLYFAQTAADGIPADAIAVKVAPGLSALAPSAKYWVQGVTGDTSATFYITDADVLGDAPIYFTVPVLVRRETASGPVDLVDFTPPAAAPSAAQINTALGGTGAAEGQPLKGVSLTNATNAPAPTAAAIKSALIAAGNGALSGVRLDGAFLIRKNEHGEGTKFGHLTSEGEVGEDGPLVTEDIQTAVGIGSNS